MNQNLEKLLERISKDDVLYSSVEEAVRQGAILPILAKLGWDIYNIRQVVPEAKAGDGRVDYCLMIGEKKAVFIEAKRVSEELERHEKQLLEYSFAEGVEIAILTNGLIWWFYLPLGRGNWQQRKYFTIDINQQNPKTAAKNFHTYLSCEAIKTGDAYHEAKSVHESRTKKRIINRTIPDAWEDLLMGPDDLLLDLFSEKVEGMCGYSPDPEILINFLRNNFKLKEDSSSKEISIKKQSKSYKKETQKTSKRKKGVTVLVEGLEYNAESVRDLYQQILEFLVDNGHIEKIQSNLPFATSSKRYLLSKQPYHPKGNSFLVPVEYNGYFMEAHKSYENALNSLQRLFSLCNLEIKEII